MIAAAAVGAGLALAPIADDAGLTVTVLGTPAEEGGGGKIVLLEAGAFDGVHAAMMVHPAPFEMLEFPVIAATSFDIRYTGREATRRRSRSWASTRPARSSWPRPRSGCSANTSAAPTASTGS